MKNKIFTKSAAKSLAGRTLRFIFGKQSGQAMMEYLLICMLIAGVAIVSIGGIGYTASKMSEAVAQTIANKPTLAEQIVETCRAGVLTMIGQAEEHYNSINNDPRYLKDTN